MEYLECLFCQKTYPLNLFDPFCPDCYEPLLYHYAPKKRSIRREKDWPLERYSEFLPQLELQPELRLGEGDTPLLKLERIKETYKLPLLFAKNEALNPTSSFKDRGTVAAVAKAISLGIDRIGTVSTGNMANSTAAYGAKAGLKTFVLVKDDISRTKLLTTAVHKPAFIAVKGDYGDLFRKSFDIGHKHRIYFMNSVDPMRIEGYKIPGFEIFAQLGFHVPDYVFVPVSSGGHLIGLMRGFLDMKTQGLSEHLPVFIGVQARGCSPIASAFASGKTRVERIDRPQTIAHAISNPDPPGGNILLKMIREFKGMVIEVNDQEILKAQRILAESEGLFCMPASATTLAGLIKLSKKKSFRPSDHVVLVITGSGVKALDALESSKISVRHTALSDLEEQIKSLI